MQQDDEWLAKQFTERRGRLREVAYRMLGSISEAEDAVQEAWLRLNRSDTEAVENLDAWLTTVVGRVCLNILRSRERRREEAYGIRVPDPIMGGTSAIDPETEAILADSIGLALLVVIETLTPAERLAFVLHDTFAISFEEIGSILGRSPTAARQLASRARRRVQGEARTPDGDLSAQQEVVNAFFAAARDGDFARLIAVLDPDVVLLVDAGPVGPSNVLRGAAAVAKASLFGARSGRIARPALVSGSPGVVIFEHDQPAAIMGFTVANGRIVEIDTITDAERLQRLNLARHDK
jgi:RNA polymerase sigma-70 factor (ECF subfamily)